MNGPSAPSQYDCETDPTPHGRRANRAGELGLTATSRDDHGTPRTSEGTFTLTRPPREGYLCSEVDQFLAEVAARRATGALVTAEQIDAARFRPVRLRPGYVMGEVDSHLSELQRMANAQVSAQSSGPEALAGPCPTCTCPQEGWN